MQIAMYTSYFANNGTSYEPKIVDEILDENNNFISKIERNIYLSNIISPNTTKIIRDSMKLCVDDAKRGTCRGLRSLNINAAGKTGTAEVANKTALNALFTGFAPFDDPEIVVTVLVENGGEGSAVALPIAREVFKEYFKK
jgi:cell division protein FtsI/penicillin-binding protein 2